MDIKNILFNQKIAGELIKNIGFGIFVNALYGMSDGVIEIFNVTDFIIGFIAMFVGIVLERK
jgi:hypothetical protein